MATNDWQSLMDEAYVRMESDLEDLSYEAFLEEITGRQRKAVLLGNLNYQVLNGGFSQWVDNGYGLQLRAVQAILIAMETPAAAKIAVMLDDIAPFINFNKRANRGCGNYWKPTPDIDHRVDDADNHDPAYLRCETLDDEYYAVNEVFIREVEACLSGAVVAAIAD